ncbi:MAG: ATP phosphoribosyltransferase regulatory subunit [Tepidanaerobacteraceae bacterium]|mgnify:FL=1|nr:ATP phosphoribosyltransferase regulatory subunit [Tepidanaerobacter sp.]HQA59656.1 ATP phosphoribosyltransferase regulatory subunit [Tepidanaerobacteraceae bacterium]HQE05170.1 ATP phosphoribosyltransferase regulatory subunit [Tepidanaerobacteraceae bacterium]
MTGYFRRPAGVKDYLPPKVRKKRRIEKVIVDIFEKWGYEEVIAPSFEYLETFAKTGKWDFTEKIFKFIDRHGEAVALRPDITTSIARMVATHYSNHDAPLRFYYLANVFRFQEPRKGRDQEFYQIGAELIGIPGLEADVEIILLASHMLEQIGIKDFLINIGHTKFLEGLLDELENSSSLKDRIAQAIKEKNFVQLKDLIEESAIRPEIKKTVLALPRFYGGAEIFEKLDQFTLNEKCIAALSELKKVWNMLKQFNNIQLSFDPGLARGIDYYTGIVFEIYSPKSGFPLGGGGRYDSLLDKFNGSRPATGFALTEDVILTVLEKDMEDTYEPYYLYYNPAEYIEAFHKAEDLRRQGRIVKMLPADKYD